MNSKATGCEWLNLKEAKLKGMLSDEEISEFLSTLGLHNIIDGSSGRSDAVYQNAVDDLKNLLRKHSRRVRDHERRSIAMFVLKQGVSHDSHLKIARRVLASYGGMPKPMRSTSEYLKELDEKIARHNRWRRGE